MASNDATIDALTSSFDATFNVTNRINDPTKPHPRYSLYKNRGDIGNQEKRRQRVLQEQKKRRDDYLRLLDITTLIIKPSFPPGPPLI